MAISLKTVFEVCPKECNMTLGQLWLKQYAVKQQIRLTILRGRAHGVSSSSLAFMTNVFYDEVENICTAFDQVYDRWKKKNFRKKKIKYLTSREVHYIFDYLTKNSEEEVLNRHITPQ